jgi:hypothetical protein
MRVPGDGVDESSVLTEDVDGPVGVADGEALADARCRGDRDRLGPDVGVDRDDVASRPDPAAFLVGALLAAGDVLCRVGAGEGDGGVWQPAG